MTELSVAQLLERSRSESVEQQRDTLRQAIAVADGADDLDLGFSVRRSYISACHNAPDALEMIAAFGWCLARHDEDPERFPLWLWYYKWITNAARGFAGVSRNQLNDLLDDMEQRFVSGSGSIRPVLKERMFVAEWLGDIDEAKRYFDEWRSATNAGIANLNDCPACELASEAELLQVLGEHEEAVLVARPLINGDQRCATEPHYTMAKLLASCRALDTDEYRDVAQQLSRDGLDKIEGNSDFVSANGDHLRHFAATGNVTDGLALLRRTAHHPAGAESNVLSYVRGARMILRLAQAQGAPDLQELLDQFDGVAEEVAGRFDERNGNTYISSRITYDDIELDAQL